MANIWSNSKAILDIINESDSYTESIFSEDSSNNGSGNSEIEDEEPHRDDDTDDDTDDNLPSTGGWSKYNSQLDFVKFNFTSQSGFKPHNPAPSEVRGFFMLFFTPELIKEFTKNTNEYAQEQIKNTPLRERSVWKEWVEVTDEEIVAFLRVILNKGMNPKPEIQDYFTEEWTQNVHFTRMCLAERFFQIFWMFHAGPITKKPALSANTRGATMKDLIIYLDCKFREYYIPGKNICTDESTIGFKGRFANVSIHRNRQRGA
jgi:hypothetical protein